MPPIVRLERIHLGVIGGEAELHSPPVQAEFQEVSLSLVRQGAATRTSWEPTRGSGQLRQKLAQEGQSTGGCASSEASTGVLEQIRRTPTLPSASW